MATKYEQKLNQIRSENSHAGRGEPDPLEVAYTQSAWWKALTIEERVIHANRNRLAECQHVVDVLDWPVDLRLSYSQDPYFHTAHLDACFKSTGVECDCQMCLQNIGVERGTESRRVNPDKVREKLKS